MRENFFYTRLPRQGFIIVNEAELKKIRRFRQFAGQNESGGTLVGTIYSRKHLTSLCEIQHVEITGFSLPNNDDIRSRFSFIRRGKHHLEFIKKSRVEGSGFVDYLGEWHTHPEEHPTPSSTDLLSWKKDFNNQMAIVIIVGTVSEWVGYWNGQEVVKLDAFKLEN